MKQLFFLTAFAITNIFYAHAQVPKSFTYQAIARDKDQKPLAGATLEVEVKILRNGTEVFSETHGDVKTASTGLFVLAVGSKEPANFSTINWALDGYSLKVSTTGALVLDLPPSPILSVPYALMAEEVRTEKQQLTLSNGNVLSISGGNSVTLPTGGSNLQAGQGIGISNNTITNTGDTDPTDDLIKTSTAGGDVSGTFSALSVDRIKGRPIASAAPQNGQVLKWDAAAGTWKPDNDLNTVGSGNTATAAPILGDGSAGNQVRLAPGNASGQVLKWNGTAWTPAADETGTGSNNTYAAGPGISVTGSSPSFTINNTGDTNAADDLTTATNFSGDVSGTFNNLQINANAIGATEIANGAVTGAKIAQQNATDGQVLKWNGTTWAPQDDIGGGTGDGWGSQTAVTGTTLTGNGTPASPLNLAPQGASNGQVLKWNGTAWIPAPDETTTGASDTYAPGLGISVTGSSPNFTINNIGDTNAADDLTNATNFGGDVSGTFNNLQINANAVGATEIANGAVTGAKIAQQNATDGQVLKWNGTTWAPQDDIGGGTGDGWGSQTAVTGTTLTGNGTPASPLNLAPQGASNGQVLKWNATNSTWIPAQDLSASTLEDLLDVTTTGVTNGQALQWNGTQWTPASPKTYSAGAGITIDAQNKIINTAPDVPLSLLGGGATTVTGTYPNLTVTTPAAATYTAGPGITVTGSSPNFTINNTGDTNATDDLTNTSTAGGDVTGTFNNLQIGANAVGTNEIANGSITIADLAFTSLPPNGAAGSDLSGSYPNPTVARIQGRSIANTAPTDGQVLRYSAANSRWEPAAVAGAGWNLTGNSGTNSGTNFIGTTDNQPISFRVNNQSRMTLDGVGRLQLFDNGLSNTFIGDNAGSGNTAGNNNLFVGKFSGVVNTNGTSNTFLGSRTGYRNTVGGENTFVGRSAGESNLGGNQNTFIGNSAGLNNTSGGLNTFIGASTGVSNTTGSQNVFLGISSGVSNTIGIRNVFAGLESGYRNIDGYNNVFLGTLSGTFNTSGNRNCFTGDGAGYSNQTGSFNTYYGVQSGEFSIGDNNCFFGAYAGRDNTTGTGIICIGAGAQPSSGNLTNAVAIGRDARVTGNNSVRFSSTLTSIGGNSNWVMTSDARIKTAVAENVPGLAFIQKLRPVTYRYDTRRQNALLGIMDTTMWEGKYDIEKMTFSGFLAQEVEQAARSVGYDFSGVDAPKNDKSLYGLRYAEFTVPLVKAVQEQQAMIEEQKRLIQALEARLSALEKTLPKDNNSQKGE